MRLEKERAAAAEGELAGTAVGGVTPPQSLIGGSGDGVGRPLAPVPLRGSGLQRPPEPSSWESLEGSVSFVSGSKEGLGEFEAEGLNQG